MHLRAVMMMGKTHREKGRRQKVSNTQRLKPVAIKYEQPRIIAEEFNRRDIRIK